MSILITSTLQDYSELIAVSVGINLAYIALSQYVQKDNSQTPFYEILSRYAKNTVTRIKNRKTKGLKSIEKNQSELEYYINSQILSPESTIIVNKIIKSFQEISTRVNNLFNDETIRIEKFIEFKYYSHLSLLLATYGLLLLFIAPLETRLHFDFRGFLLCLNTLNFFCLLHATFWELPFTIDYFGQCVQRFRGILYNPKRD